MRVVLDYFWDMSRWMLLALPCWVLGRSLFLAAGRKKTRWGHEILLTLFVLALAGVLVGLFCVVQLTTFSRVTELPYIGAFRLLPEVDS